MWAAIQRSLSGDFSAAEGEDGASIPGVALPFMYLILLANGNFVRPRRLTYALLPFATLKALAVVASIVWAFTSLPKSRSAIGLLLACYAVYFRLFLFRDFVVGLKITSPIKRKPQPPMALVREPPSSVTVVGFRSCQHHRRALEAAQDMAKKGLAGEVVDRTFESQIKFQEWLSSEQGRFGPRAQKHSCSPFVWTGDDIFLGGCDDLLALIKRLEVTRAADR